MPCQRIVLHGMAWYAILHPAITQQSVVMSSWPAMAWYGMTWHNEIAFRSYMAEPKRLTQMKQNIFHGHAVNVLPILWMMLFPSCGGHYFH